MSAAETSRGALVPRSPRAHASHASHASRSRNSRSPGTFRGARAFGVRRAALGGGPSEMTASAGRRTVERAAVDVERAAVDVEVEVEAEPAVEATTNLLLGIIGRGC